MRKRLLLLIYLLLSFSLWGWGQQKEFHILIGSNAYVTRQEKGAKIAERGIVDWTDTASIVSVYFYVGNTGILDIAINGKGHSDIGISYKTATFRVSMATDTFSVFPAGTFHVDTPGYVRIDIQGLYKTEATFGTVRELIVRNFDGKIEYVHNFSPYWGRRGPSVHLIYRMPSEPAEWFYSEMTVPPEGEVLQSFYMANGFGEGYFGIQYNSESEKRILFSVWSPFHTSNPEEVPEEDRIRLLNRGKDVTIGEFKEEGTRGIGGQSYLQYDWKAGTTYKFLTRIRPDGRGNTVYTAYFFAPEDNRWRLIASFLRPKTDKWYTSAHAFLQNFEPRQGYLSRSAVFSNQWVKSRGGTWLEITEASFSYDSTAKTGVRLDYQGKVVGENAFYLKNGGFFNENTAYGTTFKRKPAHKRPAVNLKKLEKL